jgi:hypothetical protein
MTVSVNPAGSERLPPPRLSGCCRIGQGAFAGAHGNFMPQSGLNEFRLI